MTDELVNRNGSDKENEALSLENILAEYRTGTPTGTQEDPLPAAEPAPAEEPTAPTPEDRVDDQPDEQTTEPAEAPVEDDAPAPAEEPPAEEPAEESAPEDEEPAPADETDSGTDADSTADAEPETDETPAEPTEDAPEPDEAPKESADEDDSADDEPPEASDESEDSAEVDTEEDRPRRRGGARLREEPPEDDDEEPEITEEEFEPPPDSFRAFLRRAQLFADRMYEGGFEDEDGYDSEDAEAASGYRVLRFRRRSFPEEDVEEQPPEELEKQFAEAAVRLGRRSWLVLLLAVLLCLPLLASRISLAPPAPLAAGDPTGIMVQVVLGLIAFFVGIDIAGKGIVNIFRLQMGIDSLIGICFILSILDGITVLLGLQRGNMPCICVVPTVALFCAMRGIRKDKLARQLTCRCAASVKEPDLITSDSALWNDRPAFRKHMGPLDGFTGQMLAPDASSYIFGRIAPLLLLASFLFAVIASLGRSAAPYLLWDFSVILCASTSLSGMLCFSLPYYALTRRLMPLSAAVVGWSGARCTRGTQSIILTDEDLFPSTTISMNGIKIFGDFSVNKVISYTASIVRASGSNLDKCFYELLRSQGYSYRHVEDLQYVGEGGIQAIIHNQKLLVGSASFMERVGILLPQGLRVHNAVFVAFDQELAGIFALTYTPTESVRSALRTLTHSRLRSVMATLNFTLTPARLARMFHISSRRIDYPSVERRLELEGRSDEHDRTILGILCRTGLAPYAAAVLGACRLRSTTLLSAFLAVISSIIGLVLTFYMAFAGAYQSMMPGNVLIFLLIWLIPTLLISRWVNRL